LKVSYSPRFQEQYDQLPPTSQIQFQLIDAQVKEGNLAVLRKNAWVWYIGVGGGFIAWGSLLPDDEDEFYWRAIDLPEAVPVIL
jgi:hypothetical protein